MALGLDEFDVFHSDAAQFVRYELPGFANIALVLVQSADAGNAEKIFQLVQESLLIIAGKTDCR
jgi:hypothetical protein